jgi:hypothetical protein
MEWSLEFFVGVEFGVKFGVIFGVDFKIDYRKESKFVSHKTFVGP